MSIADRATTDASSPQAVLATICEGLAGAHASLGRYETVAAEEVPAPFDRLLVHEGHMTSVLADYHGRPVELSVRRHHLVGNMYHREIVLTPSGRDEIVEYGVVRIDLTRVAAEVRAAIQMRREPLGQILMRHNVLRRIEPRWYLKFDDPGTVLSQFGPPVPAIAYGRIGTIFCDAERAVELLEVVTAERCSAHAFHDCM